MKKLDDVIRITVLTAVVECDYDLEDAARELGVSRKTIYRMFSRWKVPTPVGGNPGRVKYSEYTERCERIKVALSNLER